MYVKSEVNLTRHFRDMSLKTSTRVSCWYRIFRLRVFYYYCYYFNFILEHPISKLKVRKPLM